MGPNVTFLLGVGVYTCLTDSLPAALDQAQATREAAKSAGAKMMGFKGPAGPPKPPGPPPAEVWPPGPPPAEDMTLEHLNARIESLTDQVLWCHMNSALSHNTSAQVQVEIWEELQDKVQRSKAKAGDLRALSDDLAAKINELEQRTKYWQTHLQGMRIAFNQLNSQMASMQETLTNIQVVGRLNRNEIGKLQRRR